MLLCLRGAGAVASVDAVAVGAKVDYLGAGAVPVAKGKTAALEVPVDRDDKEFLVLLLLGSWGCCWSWHCRR